MPGPGNVGERVRNLRLTRRLSQAQLAGHDLSDSYISLIESGKRTPTPTVLRMLAERLGCTPEYLAEGVEPEQRAHLEVRERHARLALSGGDAAAAERGFADVVTRSDDAELTARARHGRARALAELGRMEEAIALFEDLREQAERDPGRTSRLPFVISLARCYHAVGDLGQATALGERAMSRLRSLGLTVGEEHSEAGRVLLLTYVDRSETGRAHTLARELLGAEDGAEEIPPADAYRRASERALEEGAIGDALYLADQALTAGSGTPERVRARLRLAAAKALLRGVPPLKAASDDPVVAAQEALDLLRETSCLQDAEATESTVERSRALVLLGRTDEAVAPLERFLDTGFALAAPTPTVGVTPHPDFDLGARAQKSAQARLVLARARMAQNDRTAALVVLRAARGQAGGLPPGRPAAQILRELGELLEAAGETSDAASVYRQALEAAGLRPSRPMTASRDLGRV